MVIVDTSIWIEFFRVGNLPALETALKAGAVILSPIVAAELLSAPLSRRNRKELISFLSDLPLHPTPLEHWIEVGELRSSLARRGVTVSTPDAHVAQCARDAEALLWTRDNVFDLIAKKTSLRLFRPDEQPD